MKYTRMVSEPISLASIIRKTVMIVFRICTVIATLVFFPFYTFAQDKVIDQIVAIVGGNIILKSEIEEMYMQYQAQGITSDGDMKCEILENLLIDKLLLAEAEFDSTIEATPSQINQQLDSQIQMYLDHFGSESAVSKYFNKPLAVIKSDMEDMIKNRLLTQQMKSKIIKGITITPSEVRRNYRELEKDKIPHIPTQYEYAQITLYPRISIEEENRVKAQLREYKKRIEEGMSFATLAVLYSEGPSASSGGELDYMGRAQLDPAYAAAAFNLRGDKVSNVVKSEFGYHIIQLIDKKGDKVKTRHILLRPKVSPEAKEKAFNALDSLANLIRKGDISFEDAAKKFSYDKNSRNNGGIVVNPNTMSSKFSIEEIDGDVSKRITKLHINEISEPFETVDENSKRNVYKIIKLINKIEGHTANLQNDYQKLAELYLLEKQDKTLKDWYAEKQSNTYIRIDDTYANCNFKFGKWIK